MEVKFIPANQTSCSASRKDPKGEHISRLHLQYSSLPNPLLPLSISNLPIEIQSKIPNGGGNLKTIADLWLQLLSIQIQNGNFWKYEDLKRIYERSHPKPRKLTGGEAPRATQESVSGPEAATTTTTAYVFGEKHVYYIRHKLQKGFLDHERPTTEDELPVLSDYLRKLEDHSDIPSDIVRLTKINKVLKAILKMEEIPGEEEFDFRPRCRKLLAIYQENSMTQAPGEAAPATASAVGLETVEVKDAGEEKITLEQLTVMPEICLTILTPAQCQELRESVKALDPPLDDAVVELMCILPHISFQGDRDHYEVCAMGKISGNPMYISRDVYCGGPIIPPQMAQLTYAPYHTWEGGATFLDTKTGEGIELTDYYAEDGDLEVCTTFKGKDDSYVSMESLLREWIDNYLTMKWVPSGGETIITDEYRSLEYLEYKAILQEFGWPHAFPLPLDRFTTFLEALYNIKQRKENQGYRDGFRMPDKWHELQKHWTGPSTQNLEGNATQEQRNAVQRDSLLSQKVYETFKQYEDRTMERAYAIAADVPFSERYKNSFTLMASTNIGEDWRVDIQPEEIIDRFKEVVALNPPAVQNEDLVKEMLTVLVKAHLRGQREKEGVYEGESADETDDDSTSDYDPAKDETAEEVVDEEYESDEEEEDMDFDIVMLEADMEKDIDAIMSGFKGFRIGEADE